MERVSMVEVITSSEFSTTFALRPEQFAWFLGAGASASAGIPTGLAMIREFKKQLFCQSVGLPTRQVDSTDPLWVSRIAEFFKSRTLLAAAGDPSEYSAAFEAVYPDVAERRRYIEEAIRKGTPSFAHRVIAALITTRRLPCVFTTNFDPMVETAATLTDQLVSASERAYLTVAALDSVDRAVRCLQEAAWPLIAKLHGDYQSVDLKNTDAELKSQDVRMRSVLASACRRFGLILVGYSGRDGSVMEALTDVLKHQDAFPGGLYWMTRSRDEVMPAVEIFLAAAADRGITTRLVEVQNIDELAGDVVDKIQLPPALTSHVYEVRPAPVLRQVPLPSTVALAFPVLRCSALPVLQMPGIARRITLANSATTPEVRALLRAANAEAIAASNGHEVAAFGPDDALMAALQTLGPNLAGTVRLDPVGNTWALGLLYDAITRALCRGRPLFAKLRSRGHFVLVSGGNSSETDADSRKRMARLAPLRQAYSAALFGNVPNLGSAYNEGLRIHLEQCADRWWCVFDPTTYVELPKDEEPVPTDDVASENVATALVSPASLAADWRRERWALRYNIVWSRIFDAWTALLSDDADGVSRTFGIPSGAGIDAEFRLSGATAWSRPQHEHSYFNRSRS
jgi:NAD-dependent SIR2 family protein deacetylase